MVTVTRAFLALLLGFTSASYAERTPYLDAETMDTRIRDVVYSDNDVIRIIGRIGEATVLHLGKGEQLASWYAGDSDAWELTTYDNKVVIKPKARNANTNIVLITNKRTYYLRVALTQRTPFYAVRFHYPQEAVHEANRAHLTKKLSASLDPHQQAFRNLHYFAAGSESLQPEQMFDNGSSHTFIRFFDNREFPTIFRVTASGKEITTNPVVRGNWVILPRISAAWRFRLGDAVLCVRNTEHQPFGKNPSNTAALDVFRELIP